MELMVGLFFIFIIVGSALGFRSFSLKRKLTDLQMKMSNLQKRLELMEQGYGYPEPETYSERGAASDGGIPQHNDSTELTTSSPAAEIIPDIPSETKSSTDERKTAKAFFQNISDRFSDRWTGILGVTALVIGFSFLAVLTALRMGPVARFFMIAGISLAFWLGSIFMERKKGRTDISCWFQSASGALILFACLGASSIPWLRWAESEIQGYAMMFVGIGVNLYFALRVQTQLFSSFHTLISLAALAVAPSSAASLSAAALVTAFSSIPMMRRQWGLHQLFAQSGFFLFIIVWVSFGKDVNLSTLSGIDLPVFAALLGGMLPGLAAPYVHLSRGEYEGDGFSFSSRTASWLYVAAGTFALGGHYSWTSIIFMILGSAAYLSGRFIGRLPDPMRRLDSIAGVVLVFAAILGLRSFHLDYFTAAGTAGTVALLAALDGRKEKVLRTVFSAAALAAATLLFILSSNEVLSGAIESNNTGLTLQRLGILYIFTVSTLVLIRRFFKRRTGAAILLIASAGAGILSVYLSSQSLPVFPEWLTAGGGTVLPLLALTLLPKRSGTGRKLTWMLLGLVVIIHIYSYLVNDAGILFIGEDLSQSLVFIVLSLTAVLLLISTQKQRISTLTAVLLITINLCSFTAVIQSKTWMILIPWALLSMLYYGLYRVQSLDKDLKKSLLFCGTGLSLLTALIALASSEQFVFMEFYTWWQRLIQSAAVFAALLIWSIRTYKEKEGIRKGILFISALFATLVFITEADMAWGTVICVSAALVMLVSGQFGPSFLKGYRSLSLLFFWAGMLILPISGIERGDFFIEVFGLSWWAALGSITLALLYITAVYLFPEDGREGLLPRLLRSRRSGSLLYPYYAGIGVFLLLSFSGPVLTSLLILESFALFIPGILLKENSFRISSFLLILFCLGRLIIIDMARTDTLERAVVFILAGAVLLGMNWMYGRFARRE